MSTALSRTAAYKRHWMKNIISYERNDFFISVPWATVIFRGYSLWLSALFSAFVFNSQGYDWFSSLNWRRCISYWRHRPIPLRIYSLTLIDVIGSWLRDVACLVIWNTSYFCRKQVLRKPNSAWPTFTMVIMLTALMTVRWTRGNGELHNDNNLNADKTEAIWFGSRDSISKMSSQHWPATSSSSYLFSDNNTT